jgi:hypothetical protein
MTIRFLDPTQGPEVLPAARAARRPLGRPAVLGLLSNTKPNADRLLRLVAEELARRLSVGRVVEVVKESSSVNARDELLDRLAEECDWVVTAVGD